MPGIGPRMTGTSTAAGTGGRSRTSSTSSPCATSPGSGSAAIAVSRARSSGAVIVLGSLFAGRQFAQREEPAAAPDAEHAPATNPFRHGQRDQLIIHRTVYPCLDTPLAHARSDQDVGRRFAGEQVMSHADRMIRTRCHYLIDIGAEGQRLMAAITHPVELDRNERSVLYLDAPAFGWGLQPERAVHFALQHAGEQTHQFLPVDRTAAIQPSSVTPDQEGQVAAFHRHATRARLAA